MTTSGLIVRGIVRATLALGDPMINNRSAHRAASVLELTEWMLSQEPSTTTLPLSTVTTSARVGSESVIDALARVFGAIELSTKWVDTGALGSPGHSVVLQIFELWHAPHAAILHTLRTTIAGVSALATTQGVVVLQRVRNDFSFSFLDLHQFTPHV